MKKSEIFYGVSAITIMEAFAITCFLKYKYIAQRGMSVIVHQVPDSTIQNFLNFWSYF